MTQLNRTQALDFLTRHPGAYVEGTTRSGDLNHWVTARVWLEDGELVHAHPTARGTCRSRHDRFAPPAIYSLGSLDALHRYLSGSPDPDLDWTSLPTYGGEEPRDTAGVWSWDETRLLVGTGSGDLRIVDRAERAA